ncbi:MAG: CAP domain-containing protein, partial [Chloroflexota bacterium]|nr:CAP domain-containing protein [Chloroflexota bacterium]
MRKQSLIALGLLLPLLLLPLAARAQSPVSREEMRELVNAARLANDVGVLAWNKQLAEAAQRHAEDLATRGDAGHSGSGEPTPEERAVQAGYGTYPGAVRIGENRAVGTALEAVAFFLADEIHRESLLRPAWREVGVGYATRADGQELWVVLF